jgi:hypothetical protein
MGEDNTIRDLAPLNIGKLFMRDNERKNRFQPKGNYLCDELVDDIAHMIRHNCFGRETHSSLGGKVRKVALRVGSTLRVLQESFLNCYTSS